MCHLEKLYQQITELTQDVDKLNQKQQFEDAVALLELRLSSLKTLSIEIKSYSKDSDEVKRYIRFLQKIQLDDQSQITIIDAEKSIALTDAKKQAKINSAVNAYKKVKGYSPI